MLRSEVETRIDLLEAAGVRCLTRRRHAAEFRSSTGQYFYLPNTVKPSVALSPLRASTSEPIMGCHGQFRFNSNFSTYPAKKNLGEKPERFGVAFDLENDSQILPFLKMAFGAL
jgi:hypothetical protein